MEKNTQPVKAEQTDGQSQVLYIDGCKVTVRYSSQKNPCRVSEIKSLLPSAQFPAKKD